MIDGQLEKGVIEVCNLGDTLSHPNQHDSVHYMPHHPVIRQDRATTKVRVVYDGSAKSKDGGFSLNDCLQTGPNLIAKLLNVLVKFRSYSIALTADIEKAFLMVRISEHDRDSLRFLWLTDPFNVDSAIIHYRFTRLVFGLWPSPAILGAVIANHVQKYHAQYPKLVHSLNQSLYVDDLITGADTVESGLSIYHAVKGLMAEGSFNIRKWHSNSPQLMEKISQFEQGNERDSPMAQTLPTGTEPESKILGVAWNTHSDELSFCLSELVQYATSFPVTKRSVLRITASIFDPLGLLAPFVIKLKMLFQQLCQDQLRWDDNLQGKLLHKWKSILGLPCLDVFSRPS